MNNNYYLNLWSASLHSFSFDKIICDCPSPRKFLVRVMILKAWLPLCKNRYKQSISRCSNIHISQHIYIYIYIIWKLIIRKLPLHNMKQLASACKKVRLWFSCKNSAHIKLDFFFLSRLTHIKWYQNSTRKS